MTDRYVRYPATASGTGTVTSVGLSDASSTPIYTVTNSPVTTSGTLTLTLKTEVKNLVFAGPATGADAQPTFRSLVSADIGFPLLAPNGSVSAPSYANSTGKTGIYFNGETGRFSGNQVNMGGWSGTQGWSLGINGFNSNTVVTIDGSAWLANANEIATYVQHSASATATSSVIAFYSDVTTSANAFTCSLRYGFLSNNRAKGAGSTITRDIAFGGTQPTQGTTANVMLTDNASMSGAFFIHQSGTAASTFGGPVSFPGLIGSNLTPLTDVTYDLGSSSKAWSNCFFGLVQGPAGAGAVIKGTTTNNNASAGIVGEYIESVISSATNISGTTGVWGNMTSISLTAGDWDVTGVWTVKANGSAMTGNVITAISINSGTTTSDQIDGSNQVNSQTASAGVDKSGAIPAYRLSISGTTTVYLKNNCTFTVATPQFVCRISARRMR